MSLVQQLIHLEPSQKAAFLKRKSEGKGSISDQIRNAADLYLNKGSDNEDEELEIVLELAKDAELTIAGMSETLDQMNKKLDQAFAEIEQLRAG